MQADGSFTVEYTAPHPGSLHLQLVLGEGLLEASLHVRVFDAAAWRFYQLGILDLAEPHAPIPDGFYEIPPPGFGGMALTGRPFELLSELLEGPFNELPIAIYVDRRSDLGLKRAVMHARRALDSAGLTLQHAEAAALAARGQPTNSSVLSVAVNLLAMFVSRYEGGVE